jgi:opacity protein-like surface antigen
MLLRRDLSHLSCRYIKICAGAVLFCLLHSASTIGQTPKAAGVGPLFDLSLGYSYFNLGLPSSERVNLNGADATYTADIHPRFGVAADVGYVRSSDVLGTGHHAYVLSYLAGPVFYISRKKGLTTYARALIGGAKIGAAALTEKGFNTGWVNRMAWAVGGGAEYGVSRSLAVRVGIDYMHTSYFDSLAMTRGDQNFRTVVSLVYLFGSNARGPG